MFNDYTFKIGDKVKYLALPIGLKDTAGPGWRKKHVGKVFTIVERKESGGTYLGEEGEVHHPFRYALIITTDCRIWACPEWLELVNKPLETSADLEALYAEA